MSVYVSSWVWQHSEATGADRLVLLAIADEAQDDGTNAYPSVPTIARKAKVDRATVLRSIERLEAQGEILVRRPQVRGRGRHNRYVVLMGRDPSGFIGMGERSQPSDKTSRAATIAAEETSQAATIPQPKTSRNGRASATLPTYVNRNITPPTPPIPSSEDGVGVVGTTFGAPPDKGPVAEGFDPETTPGQIRNLLERRDFPQHVVDQVLDELAVRLVSGKPLTAPGSWCMARARAIRNEVGSDPSVGGSSDAAAEGPSDEPCIHGRPSGEACSACQEEAAKLRAGGWRVLVGQIENRSPRGEVKDVTRKEE